MHTSRKHLSTLSSLSLAVFKASTKGSWTLNALGGAFVSRRSYSTPAAPATPTPSAPIQMNFIRSGNPNGFHKVILLHGLFGACENWKLATKLLLEENPDLEIYAVDFRNHGSSAHSTEMTLPAMANDLEAFIDKNVKLPANSKLSLVGHSMGGKVGMLYALAHPQKVATVTCVDVAPISYVGIHHHNDKLSGMQMIEQNVANGTIDSRKKAEAMLERYLPTRGDRLFMLQNLQEGPLSGDRQTFKVRLNVTALYQNQNNMLGFPTIPADASFPGPSLFVAGLQSHYLTPKHTVNIPTLFPDHKIQLIAGSHMLHAQRPREFVKLLGEWWKSKLSKS